MPIRHSEYSIKAAPEKRDTEDMGTNWRFKGQQQCKQKRGVWALERGDACGKDSRRQSRRGLPITDCSKGRLQECREYDSASNKKMLLSLIETEDRKEKSH